MAEIVQGLFGVSPELFKQQQDAQFRAQAIQEAQLDPQQQRYLQKSLMGRQVGRAIGGLLGSEDPMLAKQAAENKLLQDVQSSMSPEDIQDPYKLSAAVYQAAMAANMPELANHAYQNMDVARLSNAKVANEQAQTSKYIAEAAIKQADVLKEQQASQALKDLYEKKAKLGEVPTTEEIIATASPYMSAEKLATMMQSSADKAAYRQTMIEQAKAQGEAKIEAAKERGATQLQIAQLMANTKMEIAQLTASLKGEKSLTGREARYSDNVAIAGNEVIGGINNLINMPYTSSTGVFGSGVGAIQSSESIFGAPIGALKNRVTPDNVKRYNAEISNIGKFYGTLQSGGLAVPASVQKQFEQQFSIKDGDDELTKLTRLAQMRQTFERVIQVKKKSKNTPAEQMDMWDAWEEQVKASIPISVNDVNKIANNKNKTQTMADAMGKAELLSKSISNPAAGSKSVVRTGTVTAGVNKGKTVTEYSDGTKEYK